MRAVVFEGPGRVKVDSVPDPAPGKTDVVVEVAACGICGTDVHVREGSYGGTEYPLVPGHEVSGTVVEVGSEVRSLAIGDRVVLDPTLSCGQCEYCLNGQYNLCAHWNSMGVTRDDGGSAEFVLSPVRNAHILPPGVDLFHATLVEPLACAIHAFDVLPRRLGDHFLIYGAGTMGLLLAQLAPRAGAVSVSVVEPNPERQALAREVGVERVARAADEFDRPSWDVVIDCSGVIAAIEDGLSRVKPAGTFQHFGVAPAEATATYQPVNIVRNEISVVGSAASFNSFSRAVALFAAGAIQSAPMLSHAFPLDAYDEAIDLFQSGKGRKVQIRPGTASAVEL